MRTANIRHQFYLPKPLSDELERLTAIPGASKTSVMSDALTAWLNRRGTNELDDRFGTRLDRLGRAIDRVERKLDLATELLGVFAQYQVTLTAEHPAFGPEAQAKGRERFGQLLTYVEQRLSGAQRGVAARVLGEGETKS
jgi:hypothetical protein